MYDLFMEDRRPRLDLWKRMRVSTKCQRRIEDLVDERAPVKSSAAELRHTVLQQRGPTTSEDGHQECTTAVARRRDSEPTRSNDSGQVSMRTASSGRDSNGAVYQDPDEEDWWIASGSGGVGVSSSSADETASAAMTSLQQ
ncbi:hypothetical protein Syun_026241 [Stephania yunnanensis]|uniref:Uncharacterized protein n=1 Tax=Stephania yunnanensis TaxID=152371 RepID=A0AAP0HWI4_9MAGN